MRFLTAVFCVSGLGKAEELAGAELQHLLSASLKSLDQVRCFWVLTHFCPPFQHLLSETLTSLGIMGEPRVPPLNPTETIVL